MEIIKKLFLAAVVLLGLSTAANAQCSISSGINWNCLAGSTPAQIQTAANTAVDGAQITFGAGTYSINTISKFSNSKGLSLVCATPPPAGTTSITAWSIASNVATFTAPNSLTAGQVLVLSGFGTSTFFNTGPAVTVLASGLSGTQFQVAYTHANGSATESGSANPVGAAIVNPCLMNMVGAASAFGSDLFDGINSHFYRISGFIFDLGGNKPNFGTIYWSAYNGATHIATLNKIRLDHCTFRNSGTGGEATHIGDTAAIIGISGVYDHNLFTNRGFSGGQMSAVTTINGLSKTSTFPTVQLGTGNNLFFENNVWESDGVGNSSAEGCTDGWGFAAYVFRYNTTVNCLVTSHGESHEGGPANWELYLNNINMDAGSVATTEQACYHCFHSQGSGTFVAIGNTLTPFSGHDSHALVQAHYRGAQGVNGTFSVTGVVVSGATKTYSGTFTGGGGACVNNTMGCPGWYNMSGFLNAGNNTFVQITSVNATTMVGTLANDLGTQVTETHAATANFSGVDGSSPACDGNVAAPSTVLWSLDGNRAPIGTYAGYPCFNQPGRDYQGNYHPQYAMNNRWSDGTLVPFVIENNGGVISNHAKQIIQDREYYDEVPTGPNTTNTSPFNGSTGTGFGTLANRPTTCATSTETAFGHGAAGTAYLATDVGPAPGTIFTCSATNTWTVYWTAYTYPHPLVSAGTPIATFTPGNISFNFVPQGTSSSEQQIVLSNGGAGTLTLSANETLSDTTNFTLTANTTCTNGTALTAGQSCIIAVKANPTGTATYTSTLTTLSNAASSPDTAQTFTVTGTVGGSTIGVNPQGTVM